MQYQYGTQSGFGGMPGGYVTNTTGGYGGIQGFAARPGSQPISQGGYTTAPLTQPLTPKVVSGAPGTNATGMQQTSMTAPQGIQGAQRPGTQNIVSQWPGATTAEPAVYGQPQAATGNIRGGPGREQALEQRVRELEQMLAMKEKTIQELQAALNAKGGNQKGGNNKVRSPGRTGSGFRKVSESKPVIRYSATDQDDPIDVRLEEFYNSTGSAIQFRRINRGFYRFGDSIVELDIINHKLMARTEDGWNRGKFGPVEKFLTYYENIEREKAGILPES